MAQLRNVDHSFDLELGDVGCTIRKGFRWALLNRGEQLTLMNCPKAHLGPCTSECKLEGAGRKIGHWSGELGNLPPNLLAIEHNFEARDMKRLIEMLEVGYGKVDPLDAYTALIYERTLIND